MADRFTLYYWPIPFRAQFARYILTYAGVSWTEPDRESVTALYQTDPEDQPVPFMGPPVLHDGAGDFWLSQMPAVCSYLGETFGLMPGEPRRDALTRKVLGDCNDVLEAMTCNCGAAMWTDETWAAFAADRLPEWLRIFEALGRRHALTAEAGTLLGTPEPAVADLACAALWATMIDKLPALRSLVARHAPAVLSLSERIAALPAIEALRADQMARWGDVWCEGEIEASLRAVLGRWVAPSG